MSRPRDTIDRSIPAEPGAPHAIDCTCNVCSDRRRWVEELAAAADRRRKKPAKR